MTDTGRDDRLTDRAGASPAPRPGVDARRRAVANARTIAGLVAAHGSCAAFLATPYGAALVAHRVEVLGRSHAEVLAELDG